MILDSKLILIKLVLLFLSCLSMIYVITYIKHNNIANISAKIKNPILITPLKDIYFFESLYGIYIGDN